MPQTLSWQGKKNLTVPEMNLEMNVMYCLAIYFPTNHSNNDRTDQPLSWNAAAGGIFEMQGGVGIDQWVNGVGCRGGLRKAGQNQL